MFIKPWSLWGPKSVFSVCTILAGTFVSHNVGITWPTHTHKSPHAGREGTVEIGINCVKTLERVRNRCSHFSLSLCSVSYEVFSESILNTFLSSSVGVSFLMYYIVWVQMQQDVLLRALLLAALYWHVNYSVVCLFVLRLCVWGVQYWRGVLSVRVIEYTGWSRKLITLGACQAWTKSLHRQHNSRRNPTGWMQTVQTRPVCPSSAPATTKHTPDHRFVFNLWHFTRSKNKTAFLWMVFFL